MAHVHPTLLVINDNQDVVGAVMALVGDRYAVETANDGDEALRKLRAGLHPCIILLDLMMPRMNGAEFRSEQLRDPRLAGIPIVVFSAEADVYAQAARLAAAAHVQVPGDVLHLIDLLDQHCLK